ncbi:MAG: TrkH family potassium uptake protein [Chloroflexi bacterium]|nr:TrkH family potassium uptake protein [Chloroflexota bacterium]
MRLTVIVHYLALLVIGVGLCMLIPMGVSLYYGENDSGPFAISIGITVGTGAFLYSCTSSARGTMLSRREAILVVSLSWIVASAFSALPYRIEGTFLGYTECLFEAVSGFTTTGASALPSVENQPHGILLWRALTHWLGGMGIVVAFVALFPLLGMGTAYLVEAETPSPEVTRLRARIRDTTRAIWGLYMLLTVLQILLLLLVGNMPLFDSVCHTFATLATGGFSTKDASIGAYDNLSINIIVTCFMFLGGVNFALYYNALWRRSLRTFLNDIEFRIYAFVLLGSILLIAINLIWDANTSYGPGRAFEEAAFNATSVQTTTGFAISDFALWPAFSQIILVFLMIIGGSAGSTGGGVKVIRLIILAKYTYRQILLVFNPQAVVSLRIGGRVLSDKVVSRVVGFSALYAAVTVIACLIMTALGLDLVTAVTSVIASIGNVGPGLGAVGPMANFASIPAAGKAVLTACMLLGRIELLTALALLSPVFWRWR